MKLEFSSQDPRLESSFVVVCILSDGCREITTDRLENCVFYRGVLEQRENLISYQLCLCLFLAVDEEVHVLASVSARTVFDPCSSLESDIRASYIAEAKRQKKPLTMKFNLKLRYIS